MPVAVERRRVSDRRGRPRELHAPTRVNLSLDGADYDRLYQLAREKETSVPKLIRVLILRSLDASLL